MKDCFLVFAVLGDATSAVPIALPTVLPSISPTTSLLPTALSSTSTRTLFASTSCFDRNCVVDATLDTTAFVDFVTSAALIIELDGDFGDSSEYVVIAINGADVGTCGEDFIDCVKATCPSFNGTDVTAAARTGALTISFATSPRVSDVDYLGTGVDPICGVEDYAMRAEAVLVVTLSETMMPTPIPTPLPTPIPTVTLVPTTSIRSPQPSTAVSVLTRDPTLQPTQYPRPPELSLLWTWISNGDENPYVGNFPAGSAVSSFYFSPSSDAIAVLHASFGAAYWSTGVAGAEVYLEHHWPPSLSVLDTTTGTTTSTASALFGTTSDDADPFMWQQFSRTMSRSQQMPVAYVQETTSGDGDIIVGIGSTKSQYWRVNHKKKSATLFFEQEDLIVQDMTVSNDVIYGCGLSAYQYAVPGFAPGGIDTVHSFAINMATAELLWSEEYSPDCGQLITCASLDCVVSTPPKNEENTVVVVWRAAQDLGGDCQAFAYTADSGARLWTSEFERSSWCDDGNANMNPLQRPVFLSPSVDTLLMGLPRIRNRYDGFYGATVAVMYAENVYLKYEIYTGIGEFLVDIPTWAKTWGLSQVLDTAVCFSAGMLYVGVTTPSTAHVLGYDDVDSPNPTLVFNSSLQHNLEIDVRHLTFDDACRKFAFGGVKGDVADGDVEAILALTALT